MSEEAPKEGRPVVLSYNEPGSVRTLRQSYRGKLNLPTTEQFVKELIGESDRAAVILASSLLDDLLANAIAMKMPFEILASDLETIFRQSGPLGSFSARIEIACLFGIIEGDTFRQLTILREMRNACAHSKHTIDFKPPVLANVALHFFTNGSTPEALIKNNMKLAFCTEVAFLAVVLSHSSRTEALDLRRTTVSELLAEIKASPGKSPER